MFTKQLRETCVALNNLNLILPITSKAAIANWGEAIDAVW